MKKTLILLIGFVFLFTASACSHSSDDGSSSQIQENSDMQKEGEETMETKTDLKSLVVYFSWSGNTEQIAKEIQKQTNADIFEIVAKIPYSDDYDTVVDLAQEEQRSQARPAIAYTMDNITDYDVIYVGFPNWWGDMPMILYTFFDSYDFSNKTIAPFCTSGGSGLSDTVQTIKELETGATVLDGLHVGSSSSSSSADMVSEWLKQNNIK